jgi:hypothetical protein
VADSEDFLFLKTAVIAVFIIEATLDDNIRKRNYIKLRSIRSLGKDTIGT